MKYNQIKLDDFKKIKAGDKIFCVIGDKVSLETVVNDAFYNYDADEPDWEVETENGFFCWDSVCVLETPLFPNRSVKEESEINELAKCIANYNMKNGKDSLTSVRNVVPMVCCEICEYYRDDGCSLESGLLMPNPNDFCSYGKLKDSDLSKCKSYIISL